MPPLKFFSSKRLLLSAAFVMQIFSVNLQATEFELTPIIGYNFSPDLANATSSDTFSTSNEFNLGLALAWQDTPTGQGQVLINYISRDFTSDIDQSSHSFDTLYTHFSGVALFKERDYVTTVSLGIGATYFKSDFDNEISPSLTAAVGTRYQLSDKLTVVTELRAYATLTDDDNNLFCQDNACVAHFDSAIWFDSQITVGLTYKF